MASSRTDVENWMRAHYELDRKNTVQLAIERFPKAFDGNKHTNRNKAYRWLKSCCELAPLKGISVDMKKRKLQVPIRASASIQFHMLKFVGVHTKSSHRKRKMLSTKKSNTGIAEDESRKMLRISTMFDFLSVSWFDTQMKKTMMRPLWYLIGLHSYALLLGEGLKTNAIFSKKRPKKKQGNWNWF